MCETTSVEKYTQVYLDETVAKHGVPLKITSDRDSSFTSDSWASMQCELRSCVTLSTIYYPQTDGHNVLGGPEMIQDTIDKIQIERGRMKAAQDRQKSYAVKRRRPIELQVDEFVMLKVSPWKGIMRFRKKGKLSPIFIGPFKIIQRIGKQAYHLELLEDFTGIHDVFHVSYLRKCLSIYDETVPLFEVKLDNKLRYVEEYEEIVNERTTELRNKEMELH
ncbi:hypothetical protein Lser_V15G32651 [Lactuca serriola]